MANEFDIAKADGLFKDVYGGINDVRPKSSVIQRLQPFESSAKVGDEYVEGLEVKAPQGWSHTGTATTVSALKGVRNAVIVQAKSKSYESILREQVQYKTLSQATSAGPAAFKKATSAIVQGMQLSAANRLEALLLHGQNGLGEVESVADGGSSTLVATLTAGTFSAGLWYSLLGATIDSVTSGTTVNNGSGVLIVNSVDVPNRAVTLAHSGTYSDQCAAGDILSFEGCGITATPLDLVGLMEQCANTSGTIHGLSASTYPNLAANTYTVSGNISFQVLEDAMHRVRSRGGESGKLVALCGRAYSTLVSDIMDMGKLDMGAAAKSITAGVKGLTYDAGADLGEFDLVFHPFMRDGEILIYPKEQTVRGGAADITFNLPGGDERFFQYVAGYNAFELQCLMDQFIMVKKPSASMVISGITYS